MILLLRSIIVFALLLVFSVGNGPLYAHGNSNARGIVTIDSSFDHITRVITGGYPESFSLSPFFGRALHRHVEVNGKRCLRANFLGFDVDDDFAFDIDEELTLRLLLSASEDTALLVGYDANGNASPAVERHLAGDDGATRWEEFDLTRARMAGRGALKTDLAVLTRETMLGDRPDTSTFVTVCDIELKRSNKPRTPEETGTLNLKVTVDGSATPARIGLYDSTGRAPLPNKEAIAVDYFEETVSMLQLRDNLDGVSQPWPHENRYYFYIGGKYQAEIPAGDYELVIVKGPDFAPIHERLTIEAGSKTKAEYELEPVVNLADAGWFAGDVHVHIARMSGKNDKRMLKHFAAEGLNVANTLEMINPAQNHFGQFAFGQTGRYGKKDYVIAPGIEGPRTALRGHTIALNPAARVDLGGRDFLYHETLSEYQDLGALTGYAHLATDEFNAAFGLALDAPFGLVNFVEAMQNSRLLTNRLFDHLNLGERISPVAGSDFPYYEQPGAVRSYVKVDGDFSADAWFDGLQKGKTFATNGPLMSINLAGADFGAEIAADGSKKTLRGMVTLHPSFGDLSKVDVIRCGDIIATFEPDAGDASTINFAHDVVLDAAGWIAIYAEGTNSAVAQSAAFYLVNEDGSSLCMDKAPQTITRMEAHLAALEASQINVADELEYWELANLPETYRVQRDQLLQRIEKARAYYGELADKLAGHEE